jgi:hypothetical protein
MEKLQAVAGGPELDISTIWVRLALDNLLSTSFSINRDVQNEEKNEPLIELLAE